MALPLSNISEERTTKTGSFSEVRADFQDRFENIGTRSGAHVILWKGCNVRQNLRCQTKGLSQL